MSTRKHALAIAATVAVFMTVAGTTLGWWSYDVRKRALKERASMQAQVQELRVRYESTARDEPIIRQTISQFDRLRSSGIIGPEHRLDWADRMRTIRTQHKLAQLDFELAPRDEGTALVPDGSFRLTASRMRIHAGLLHEGDLFRLIEDLRTSTSAIVAPRSCVLTPQGNSPAPTIKLIADCTVDWLTVHAPDTGGKP